MGNFLESGCVWIGAIWVLQGATWGHRRLPVRQKALLVSRRRQVDAHPRTRSRHVPGKGREGLKLRPGFR